MQSKIAPVIQYGLTATVAVSKTTTATVTNGNTVNRGSGTDYHCRSVEIWTTTCIVTNFGRKVLSCNPQQQLNDKQSQQWILINPCNSGLTGCKLFPYFPKGGPLPKQKVESTTHRDWQPLGYVTQWGGMEVGTGMLYPISVVDGLVHIYGGSKLQTELYWLRQKHRWNKFWSSDQSVNINEPCPVGHAVVTSAGSGPLAKHYDHIVHTTPPFYKYNTHPTQSSEMLLSQCYSNALDKATLISAAVGTTTIVALPLLGSGARGFPVEIACEIAAESIVKWLLRSSNEDALNSNQVKTITLQNHIYKHGDGDYQNIITTQETTSFHKRLSSCSLQRGHERIVFGLLDSNVAKELADRITNQSKNERF
jgi:O-acetyl-ADP-ribose deacetylase (regulator of RNase III)